MFLLNCAISLIFASEKKWKFGLPNDGVPPPPSKSILILVIPSFSPLIGLCMFMVPNINKTKLFELWKKLKSLTKIGTNYWFCLQHFLDGFSYNLFLTKLIITPTHLINWGKGAVVISLLNTNQWKGCLRVRIFRCCKVGIFEKYECSSTTMNILS